MFHCNTQIQVCSLVQFAPSLSECQAVQDETLFMISQAREKETSCSLGRWIGLGTFVGSASSVQGPARDVQRRPAERSSQEGREFGVPERVMLSRCRLAKESAGVCRPATRPLSRCKLRSRTLGDGDGSMPTCKKSTNKEKRGWDD